jgi:hypothetical protein
LVVRKKPFNGFRGFRGLVVPVVLGRREGTRKI